MGTPWTPYHGTNKQRGGQPWQELSPSNAPPPSAVETFKCNLVICGHFKKSYITISIKVTKGKENMHL